jgi:hypothetical protein
MPICKCRPTSEDACLHDLDEQPEQSDSLTPLEQ